MTGDGWDTPVDSLMGREERMAKYGGAKYGGIEPSRKTPNVFIYSDPARGKSFGYNFDGWNEDNTVFLYTGEGRVGDQQMRDGNRAILEHHTKGRALRLFVADGLIPGTDQKNHRYVGKFEVDRERPYFLEEAPDQKEELRTVFVFRLHPLGEALHRSADRSCSGDIRLVTETVLVPLEAHISQTFENPGAKATTATRRESELCARYVSHLGRYFQRWKITPAGETRPLFTDLYDQEENELYEAKGTATRDAVRRSVGQLLDYQRHITPKPNLTLLLPHRPSDDLINFLHSVGISCVYEEPDAEFSRIDAAAREG
ncbi:restriction endonuclease [Streptosporangium sp. NPDC049644]|uniref:restriction endonuclease n=1 Tax=Streptosporangium sp. NPDC049644 TaxID=3155507 RepID=UPI00343DB6D5